MSKLALVTILFAAACSMPASPASFIERDRVVAAKVTVDHEPARAWPAPGESATITWISAAPDGAAELTWSLSACPAATSTGSPMCAAPSIAAVEGAGSVPTLQFTTPADVMTDSLVVFGTVCAAETCNDVSRHVFIAHDDVNHNPSLDVVTVASSAWSTERCSETVQAGDDAILVGATLDDGDRERFTTTTGESRRESLELSAFATAGEMMQPKAFVDPDDTRAAASVAMKWQPPAKDEVADEGETVTFTFVVSDGRGGVDTATRTLCVVP